MPPHFPSRRPTAPCRIGDALYTPATPTRGPRVLSTPPHSPPHRIAPPHPQKWKSTQSPARPARLSTTSPSNSALSSSSPSPSHCHTPPPLFHTNILPPGRHEQTALLTSLHLTSTTLSTLPSYTAIAPTLSQIPHYESKLARLKTAMAQQQHDVAELKRRALEAGAKRRLNLSRIEEKRRGERERDRTVLKAKHVGEEEPDEDETALLPEMEVKTVKRKKKARQADIQ